MGLDPARTRRSSGRSGRPRSWRSRRPRRLSSAIAEVDAEIAAIDRAYSRFRPDSELMRLCNAGRPCDPVSPLLAEALAVALHAAAATGGLVDPTVGAAVSALGYDRDYASVTESHQPSRPSAGSRAVGDRVRPDPPHCLRRPGTQLDLGATGKALAVDRAVARAPRPPAAACS